MTVDGSEPRLYLDGSLLGTTTYEFAVVDNESLIVIGRGPAMSFRFYTGRLDEVRFFNRALTANEIKATHEAGGPD